MKKKISPFTAYSENKITAFHIPTPIYTAIKVVKDTLDIAEVTREVQFESKTERLVKNAHESITTILKNEAKKRNVKYISAKIWGDRNLQRLIPDLWLTQDIVPYIEDHHDKQTVSAAVSEVSSYFNEENIVYVQVDGDNEVAVSELVSLKEYEETSAASDFTLLARLAKEFRGKKLIFINATPQGGGVALMRHALIRLYKLLGVDAHWYVLIPKQEAFNVTKLKFHNVLQAVAPKNVSLGASDMQTYNEWIRENAGKFIPILKSADVIIIDDPQPSGLIPLIKRANPKIKILYRSHIQIVAELAGKKNTPQNKTWNFLWNFIKDADVFVSHPMKEFIPSDVPKEKIVYMPATTDPLDGLNKPLTETQMGYYMKLFGKLLILQGGQTPLDAHRPYIVQIARFDPAKGIPDVIESYRLLCEMLKKNNKVIPQLVIAGNAAIDDPEGVPIFQATLDLLQTKPYRHLAEDVKVARLPHMDQLLNTLLRKSKIVLQLSIKEGFEIKVTEAFMKGKPVIAYRTGGIPLQIEEGINGFLVQPGDTQQVADYMYELLENNDLYRSMCSASLQYANKDYLTVPNALCWLYLAVTMTKKGEVAGHYAWVKDLAEKSYQKNAKSLFSIVTRLLGSRN